MYHSRNRFIYQHIMFFYYLRDVIRDVFQHLTICLHLYVSLLFQTPKLSYPQTESECVLTSSIYLLGCADYIYHCHYNE